jgi:hypothetical protein
MLKPTKYSNNRESTLSFDIPHKQVHIIDPDGCGSPENWEKNFRPLQQESENKTYDSKREYHHPQRWLFKPRMRQGLKSRHTSILHVS